jgi:hypothetical protein
LATTGLVAPPPWLNPPAAATFGAGFTTAGFAFAPSPWLNPPAAATFGAGFTTAGFAFAPSPWLNPPAAATFGAGFTTAGFAFAPLEAAASILFVFLFSSGFLGIVLSPSGVRTSWFRSYSSPAIAVMAVIVAWAVVDTWATRDVIATGQQQDVCFGI